MQLINVATSTFGSSLGKVINATFLLNNAANDVKYRCIHNQIHLRCQVYIMMRVFGLRLEIQKMYDVNPLFSFM